MRTWNTTWHFGPFVLKVFRGVAAKDRYKNEQETSGFLRSRGIPVARMICSSARFKAIAYVRAKGIPLDTVPRHNGAMATLHDAAEQLVQRAGLAADKPLGWLHRPSTEEDMVSVFQADLERLSAAAYRMGTDLDLREQISSLANMRLPHVTEKMLCLADFSPKNLLVEGEHWTLVDLESAIIGPPDVFWAKAAVNMVRDASDRSLALEQARWFWSHVRCEDLGRATIVWALARMLHFRSVVGGPSKDPRLALMAVSLGLDVRNILEALADV